MNNNNNRPPAGRGDDVTTAPRVEVKTEPPSSRPSRKVKSRPSLEVDVKFQASQKPLPAPPSPLSPGDGVKMPLPSPPSPFSPDLEVETEPWSDSESITLPPPSPEIKIKVEPSSDSEPTASRSTSPEVKIKVEPSSDSEPFASPPSFGSTSGPARVDTPDLTPADVKIEPGVTPPAPQASTSAHAPSRSGPPAYQASTTADAQRPPGPGPPSDHGQVHVNNPHWIPHNAITIAVLEPFCITLPPSGATHGCWHIPHRNRILVDHDRLAIPNAPVTSSEVWDLPPEQIVLALTYTNPRPPRLGQNGELVTRHVSEDFGIMQGYAAAQSCGLCGGFLLQLYIYFRLLTFFPWLLFHLDHLRGLNVYLPPQQFRGTNPENDVLGLAASRPAWIVTCVIIHAGWDQADEIHEWLEAVRRAFGQGGRGLSFRSLDEGSWGTVEMGRLILRHTPRVSEEVGEYLDEVEQLLEEILLPLSDDYLHRQYLTGPITFIADGDISTIFSDPTHFESDFGFLTEIALLWPDSARQYVRSEDDLLDDIYCCRRATVVRAAVRKMEIRLGYPTNWPELLALQCFTGRLRRGAWFTHVCLTHLLNWLNGSYVSRRLFGQLDRARNLIRDVAGPGGLAPLLDDDWPLQD